MLGARNLLLQQWLRVLWWRRWSRGGFWNGFWLLKNPMSPLLAAKQLSPATAGWRLEKKLRSSTKKLRSFSKKVLPAFPNASVATTAHLSCQPWPGFLLFRPEYWQKGEAPGYQVDWQRSCPKQNTLPWKGFRAVTQLHQPQELAAEGWAWGGKREAKSKPCTSSVQLVAVQSCSWDWGQQTCPGWRRSTKWLSLPPPGKRDCYSRDTETWCHRESRHGSPFLLTRKFSTTDLHVKLWWPEGAHARLMGSRDISSRACSLSPAIAGAEGRSSIVQHRRATCSVLVSVLQGFTLTYRGGRRNGRGNTGNETNWCCHQPLGDSRGCKQPWDRRLS